MKSWLDWNEHDEIFIIVSGCCQIWAVSDKHDGVIKWKHFPRYWPFVRGIHRSPVNSPHKGQWRGDLMFSLICVWINDWVNNREAGDFRRYRTHYDVILMIRKMMTGMEIFKWLNTPPKWRHFLFNLMAWFSNYWFDAKYVHFQYQFLLIWCHTNRTEFFAGR